MSEREQKLCKGTKRCKEGSRLEGMGKPVWSIQKRSARQIPYRYSNWLRTWLMSSESAIVV
jgi:hypothetical protein